MPKHKTDARLNEQSGVRKDRHMDNRSVQENRKLTDDQRLMEFRRQTFQSVLPDIPDIPGYHVCWLTTENTRDSIHGRTRQGYEPIKASDIPGWELYSMKTGDWVGCIGTNEMIAFKLPLELYEAYMYENHHAQPLEEENKLKSGRQNAEAEASDIAKKPISFEITEGMSELGIAPDPGSFEDTLTNRSRPLN